MTDADEIRRVIRVTFEGDSMRGSLNDCGGHHRPFSGWLDLFAAIEELRAAAEDQGKTDMSCRHRESNADSARLSHKP
jgi:hypothetical protein